MIFRILGMLLMLLGGFMLLCVIVSFIFGDDPEALLISGLVTASGGSAMWFLTKTKNKTVSKKDGYLVVTAGWLVMSFFGSLPYIFSGTIPDLTNAFFETMSGFSTTGATILIDIESVDKGILFWRSLTQWIGGMGIIVLTVAILPIFGIGGLQLFVAEAPGISPDKMKPRIKETAKRLWWIYLILTGTETILLWIAGMTFFDAVNHAMTTMATGGFSTKNASIAYYQSPAIQYIIIAFMALAGTNFTMTYFAMHGRFLKLWKNEEFKFYFTFTIAVTLLIGFVIYGLGHDTFEKSMRDSLFQVVSIITTTGYITHDYTAWTPLVTVLFFLMMFFGASAGSTAGGVKLVRHLLLIRNSILEFKRQLHPTAIIPVRFNGKAVSQEIILNILAFFMIYIFTFAFGCLVLSIMGIDFNTALGATATCLGNIGPGIGSVGPVDNFAHLPAAAKWFLSFIMLTGRLELFTVLMILTPYFWRKF